MKVFTLAPHYLPGFKAGGPIRSIANLAAELGDEIDFRIVARSQYRAITLGGIRSTGLSAALGLAKHALKLHSSFAAPWPAPTSVPSIAMPNLAETRERDWQRNSHGEIVCHCEMVTRREIEAALTGPLPAGDFGGLRRRTRAGMGRCQGFYCNAHLAAITAGKFASPLAVNEEPVNVEPGDA